MVKATKGERDGLTCGTEPGSASTWEGDVLIVKVTKHVKLQVLQRRWRTSLEQHTLKLQFSTFKLKTSKLHNKYSREGDIKWQMVTKHRHMTSEGGLTTKVSSDLVSFLRHCSKQGLFCRTHKLAVSVMICKSTSHDNHMTTTCVP